MPSVLHIRGEAARWVPGLYNNPHREGCAAAAGFSLDADVRPHVFIYILRLGHLADASIQSDLQ